MIIKTKNFSLRPIRMSDSRAYFECMMDEETRKNLTSFPETLQQAEKEIKGMQEEARDKDSKIFTIVVDKHYAGNVLLQHQNWDKKSDEGRMHIWIHPAYRGRGLATQVTREVEDYAFHHGFNRVYIQCKAINAGVMHICEKLGYRRVKSFKNDKGVEKVLWV